MVNNRSSAVFSERINRPSPSHQVKGLTATFDEVINIRIYMKRKFSKSSGVRAGAEVFPGLFKKLLWNLEMRHYRQRQCDHNIKR